MVRRVVTRDREGLGEFVEDGVAPAVDLGGGAIVHEVWLAPNAGGAYAAGEPWSLDPPKGGSVFRISEIPAGFGLDQPWMHKTKTIDFGVIIEGELTLLLDSGETVLKVGDTFVQRQANHAWVNRTDKRCLMAVVLVDGAQ